MREVRIYSDGACSGNPGPGGWGAILQCDNPKAEKELSGAELNTTNNRMEMLGIISALELLKEPCKVTVITDSSYVCDTFKKDWITGWIKRGWKTAGKKPVKNQDLWERMLKAKEPHSVEWQWVRGHAGHPENERCDTLAVEARESIV